MKNILSNIVTAILLSLFILPFGINGYKLAGCDFEAPFKCEVSHAIGVFMPPASIITVWFDDDRK